jgi:aspartate/methionine/tyrosine aminotransferase
MTHPVPAARTAQISPFYVMEIVKAAARLQAAGRSIIHMSIGEPDFTAPDAVQQAAQAAIAAGATGYTPALGLDALRERIAAHYQAGFGVEIDPARIAVTAGASAALLLAMAALLERDAEVLMPDPSYPCNRHFVSAFEGRPRLLPCGPDTRFQFTADQLRERWSSATAGVILASPSNPTGTTIAPAALAQVLAAVRDLGGFSVVDEIYQGLCYDHPPSTALAIADDAIVINSFSKYFSMTGWRLGWLVVPPTLVPTIEKLAQNLFICASAVSQRAAIACFDAESMAIYESRRKQFQARRDYLVPALRGAGLEIPVVPDGAFYIYADVSQFTTDSWEFAFDLLNETGVCVVPGRDFGEHATRRYVRVSYATSLDKLQEAVARIERYLAVRPRRGS